MNYNIVLIYSLIACIHLFSFTESSMFKIINTINVFPTLSDIH